MPKKDSHPLCLNKMRFQSFYNNDTCTEQQYDESLKYFLSITTNSFRKVLKHYNCHNVIPYTLAEFKTRCATDPTYRKTLVLVDSSIQDKDQCYCEGIPYNEVYTSSMKYIHTIDDTEEFTHISEFAEYSR